MGNDEHDGCRAATQSLVDEVNGLRNELTETRGLYLAACSFGEVIRGERDTARADLTASTQEATRLREELAETRRLEQKARDFHELASGQRDTARAEATRLRGALELADGVIDGLINGVDFGLRRYVETGDGLLAAALERGREGYAEFRRLARAVLSLPDGTGTPLDALDAAMAKLKAVGADVTPPCPACVSEYGQVKPDCGLCGGSGVCPSIRRPPAGEGVPANNWVNDVLDRATRTWRAMPEWMQRLGAGRR